MNLSKFKSFLGRTSIQKEVYEVGKNSLCLSDLLEASMSELIKTIAESLELLADKSAALTPLLQIIAIIIALVVIGLMVTHGSRG
jgi:hypothetical protein